jgi:hypothetical protein
MKVFIFVSLTGVTAAAWAIFISLKFPTKRHTLQEEGYSKYSPLELSIGAEPKKLY